MMFMLLTGRLEKCWQLSTAVSRVCIALGGQYFANLASLSNAEDSSAARYGLALCFMFDKSLSMSMNRASALPDMKLNPSALMKSDPNRPHTALLNIYLELAVVQDGIVRGQRFWAVSNRASHLLDLVQSLQQKMWKIRENIELVRYLQQSPLRC